MGGRVGPAAKVWPALLALGVKFLETEVLASGLPAELGLPKAELTEFGLRGAVCVRGG